MNGRETLLSVRKVNLVVDGRMDDWQGKRTKVGERVGGSYDDPDFKPLQPLSGWLTVGKKGRQVRKTLWSLDIAAE